MRRLVAASTVALLLVVASAAFLIGRGEAQQREALAARFDTRQATASRFISAYIDGVFARQTGLASRSFSGRPDTAGFAGSAADQGYDAAVLLDADGRLLASQPSNPAAVGNDLTTRYAHLRDAVRGVQTVSGVVPSAVRGEPIVAFAAPFETPGGRRVFSGAYAVQDTPLAPFVRNATPFRTAHVLVVDARGQIVAGSGSGEAGRSLADVDAGLASFSAKSGFVGSGTDRQYVTQGAIEGATWRLLFAVDADELFDPLSSGARLAPWVALGGAGLLGLIMLGIVYRYMLQRVRLQETEARQRAILDSAGEAFVGMDAAGLITDWNASATRLLGWSEREAVGQRLVELVVPAQDRAAHTAGVDRFLRTGMTSLPAAAVRVHALHKDGSHVDVEFSLSRIAWESGWHFHAFLRDISGQLEHDRQLRELALTDALTGLLNRRSVLTRLDQALARADRHESPVAVLFIDIDKFKDVNDRYGHAVGDALLVNVGTRLRTVFRTEDSIARLGGDEFLVVCEDVNSRAEGSVLVDRTRTALAQPYEIGGLRLTVTASVGLAADADGMSADGLLARADAQMYDAKATRQAFIDITTA